MELKELLRLTRTKLIEEAMKVPDVSGAHGMTKEELIQLLAKVHGIDLEVRKGQEEKATIGQLKKEIQRLKGEREEALKGSDQKKLDVLKKK